MTPAQWQQVRELLQTASKLEPGQREAFLDKACAGDQSLRDEVDFLLAHPETASSSLDTRLFPPVIPADNAPSTLAETDPSVQKLSRDVKPPIPLRVNHQSRFKAWALFAFGFVYIITGTNVVLNAYGTFLSFQGSYDGWNAVPINSRVLIMDVDPNGPASILRKGDEIVSLNGQPPTDLQVAMRTRPGSTYLMAVRRDGQVQEFALRTVPPTLRHRLQVVATNLIRPFIILLIGIVVFLLNPTDKRVLLLSLLCAMLSNALWINCLHWLPPFLLAITRTLSVPSSFLGFAVYPIFLHFFLLFPESSPIMGRFPRLKYYIYIPSVILASALTFTPEQSAIFKTGLSRSLFTGLFFLTSVGCFTAGLVSLAVNYLRANQVLRRKVRIVIVGSLLGILPGVAFIAALIFVGSPSPAWVEWLSPIAALSLPIMPFSLAYAVVRHRVLPVSLIIRRGVRYLLAKNALRVILALPVVGVLYVVIAKSDRPLNELMGDLLYSHPYYPLLIVAAALGLGFRRRLGDWIDRKFFREAYNQDQIMRELIDEVRQLDSISEVSRLVGEKVFSALHLERLYFFYREADRHDLLLGYSCTSLGKTLRIPEEFELLRFMEYHAGAQDFPFPAKIKLPQPEKDWLAGLETSLIVPMNGTDNRLSGLLLLGPKKSEVPFTNNDRQLLETLADQIAIVYENIRLKDRVAKDHKIQREVLARVEERRFNLLKECPACGACYDSAVQRCASDQLELTLTLPVERTIDGRYRLDQLLGKGGMGAVYEAMDLRLNRRVAVKILGGGYFGNEQVLRRFKREAQASARLSHPHIVSVYDYGVLSTEGAYLVMERLRGRTLGARLKEEVRLSPIVAAELLDQVFEAVKTAHQEGIIHRDLKPDNIFLAEVEEKQITVKILDFGLAKVIQSEIADSQSPTNLSTAQGVIMGTLGYMSPEQLTGGAIDERSDIFSLGVISVEVLTGRRPFKGKNYQELLHEVMNKPFRFASDSPKETRLGIALQKCLAREPNDRFPSVTKAQQEIIPAIAASGHEIDPKWEARDR